MDSVFLLLGGNIGNRELFLAQAIDLITQQIAPTTNVSALYETASWGKTDEADYLNQVIELKTDLPAQMVLKRILEIELVLGRERKEKWGARIIDIDILFYGDEVIDEPGLMVPHPQLQNRRFTLEPLAEIAPNLVHPVLHKNILLLKKELKDDLIVKKL